MVRNIVVLGGNSHPNLVESVCNILGIPPCARTLSRFEVGESRCEIKDSVRGKDVYIIQSCGGDVNDHFIDLCIMISACKTGSARRIVAVLPLFPYSRQPDIPYNKPIAAKSVPATPGPNVPVSATLTAQSDLTTALAINGHSENGTAAGSSSRSHTGSVSSSQAAAVPPFTTHDYDNYATVSQFQAKPGYKQWVAQAGILVANLLTCAGANHIITMDLHDPQYQGFFDVPVDNLYSKSLLQRYIQQQIPDYRDAVIVSPDAGGAKRATAIADSLGMDFALIHKERRPIKITDRQSSTMMLVGNVTGRVCILVDDLADTANTITRAAKLLKREGATYCYALLTHGILNGDAIARINASVIDKIVSTNSVPQTQHRALCSKLDVLDIAPIFAEAIRRVHHGESISVLFQHN
ncbi:ribose-phosphate pyrophosphokinase [Grosmannia clavigera kw1407]|uniref:Ribose-phosphate pyrophosphokinase n=1 Tax=Grosmannia clavigera (strain kw1407 / UAMH 11150) TaxID=655863 RepID=F0XDE0_GROCL|nr:ribose-phosphate pyrophosphokinase [Grosmannia clavigera kw1407]EFX04009.1 ribose-phosphate pyrophosphokinase [Grosmannia clavigera kw1407]